MAAKADGPAQEPGDILFPGSKARKCIEIDEENLNSGVIATTSLLWTLTFTNQSGS